MGQTVAVIHCANFFGESPWTTFKVLIPVCLSLRFHWCDSPAMRNYSENALYLGRLKMQIVCVVFPLFNLNLWSVRNDLFRSQNTRINQLDYLKYNFGNRLLAERRNRLLVCSEWATGFEIDTIWTGRPTSLLWVALSLTVYAEKEQRAGVLLRKMQTKILKNINLTSLFAL